MAVAARTLLMRPDRRKERADMEARRKEFDEAVNDLRRAKDRLLTATDLYLERLEGTRRDERHP